MKQNKLIKWLYALFMFVPFLAIGVKCLYVTFNKNAYQSYSDETIQVETKLEFTNFTNVIDGNYYYLDTSNVDTTATYNSASYKIEFSNLQGVNAPSLAKYFTIGAPIGQNNKWSFTFYDENDSYISYTKLETLNTNYFTFYILSTHSNNSTYFTNSTIGATLSTYTFIQETNKLDNAFYYAIDEFNDVGFNKLDFISWFNFLYENTNIYTTFLNCYINYMLFVSVAFFIPRVLYWFVNYAYSLTETFSSKSNGGGW